MPTPSRAVFCVKNATDDATLTAIPEMVSTLPVTNLQNDARARVARTTSSAQQEIRFTWLGMGMYLTFLKIYRHNLEAGATWRIQLFSDAAWTTQIYDSGTIDAYEVLTLGELDWGNSPLGSGIFDGFLGQKQSHHYFDRVQAGSGIVTITNVGNSAGYLEFSRLFAGDHLELAWNPETVEFGWEELTEQSRTAGGSIRSDGTIAFRKLDLQVSIKDQIQRAQLADMFRYAGLRSSLFFSLFPGQGGEIERDHDGLWKFSKQLPKITQGSGLDNLKTRISLEEV